MNTPPPKDVADLQERANRQYWESSARVDDVAGELGISRNALYAAVRPTGAGVACAHCGEPAYFANRSRRMAGEATCLACAGVTQVADAHAADPLSPGESFADADRHSPEPQADRLRRFRDDLAAVPPERAALIGGAAALGVAVGAVAVRAARRRS